MKKRNLLKRIAAIAMSAAMVLGMASAVSAAPAPDLSPGKKGTLTIIKKDSTENHNPIEGVTFKYAKVGNFETDADGNVTGYTITNSALKDILTANENLTAVPGTTDVYDGKAIQDALTEALKTQETAITAIADQEFGTTNAQGTVTNPDVKDLGLYLIVETSAPVGVQEFCPPFIVSIPILSPENPEAEEEQQWVYDVTAIPKNSLSDEPDGNKEIVDIEGSQDDTNASASVGNVVTFKITSDVPSGDGTLEQYIIRDTMSKGLAFNYNTVTVTGFAKGEEPGIAQGTDIKNLVTITPGTDTDGTEPSSLEFKFSDPDKNLKNIYKTIVITYDATITKDAVVQGKVDNKAGLDYKNDDTIDVEFNPVEVETYGYQFTKTDANERGLAGAEFKLYSDEACDHEVTVYDANGNQLNTIISGTDGIASFYGLAAGTYYLKEISAPDGYTALTKPVEITVNENSKNASQINIVNTKGFTLPATGGMGTTIFTIGGIVLMAGAAVLIVRMNRKEKEK